MGSVQSAQHEVSRRLLKCGKKAMLEQATFCQLLQD